MFAEGGRVSFRPLIFRRAYTELRGRGVLHVLKLILVAGALALMSGCSHNVIAVPAGKGKAFIVQSKAWSDQTVWNCDALDGKPVCFRTIRRSE